MIILLQITALVLLNAGVSMFGETIDMKEKRWPFALKGLACCLAAFAIFYLTLPGAHVVLAQNP